MFLTLGVLGFIQTFFLPGMGLLRLMGYRLNLMSAALLIAPLSLAFNFFLVFILTALGIYSSTALFFVFYN